MQPWFQKLVKNLLFQPFLPVVYVCIVCVVNAKASKMNKDADIGHNPLVVCGYLHLLHLTLCTSICILAGGQWRQTVGCWKCSEDSRCGAGERSDWTGEHLQAEEPGEAQRHKMKGSQGWSEVYLSLSLSVVPGGWAAGSATLREDRSDEEARGRPGGPQRAHAEAQSPHRSGLLEIHACASLLESCESRFQNSAAFLIMSSVGKCVKNDIICHIALPSLIKYPLSLWFIWVNLWFILLNGWLIKKIVYSFIWVIP